MLSGKNIGDFCRILDFFKVLFQNLYSSHIFEPKKQFSLQEIEAADIHNSWSFSCIHPTPAHLESTTLYLRSNNKLGRFNNAIHFLQLSCFNVDFQSTLSNHVAKHHIMRHIILKVATNICPSLEFYSCESLLMQY